MRLVKIKDLDSTEFSRLKEFLANHPDKHISQYFIDMDIVEENDLSDVFNNEMSPDDFKTKYGDREVNVDGDSEKQIRCGWKCKAEALDLTYVLAKDKNDNKSKQIAKARTLSCLKNEVPGEYAYEKLRFLSHFNNIEMTEKLKKYETITCVDIKKMLAKVMSYFSRESHASTFIKYVMYYLDVVMLDVNQELTLTKEYITTINNIIK